MCITFERVRGGVMGKTRGEGLQLLDIALISCVNIQHSDWCCSK